MKIIKDGGCWSQIGMVGNGEQELSLNGNLGGIMGVGYSRTGYCTYTQLLGMGWLRIGMNGYFGVGYPQISNLGYFSLLQVEDAGLNAQLSMSLSTLLDSITNKFVRIGIIMLK